MHKNNISLSLKYNSTSLKHPRVLIKSDSLHISLFASVETEEINIPNVPIGVHDLSIQLINKTTSDTVVNNDGVIIEDLYVEIKSIKVNDVEFCNKINAISTYTDNSNNSVSTYGWIGFVTEFKLILQVPGWYFARNLSMLPEGEKFHYDF